MCANPLPLGALSQVLSFSDYSFTNWGISPPVLRQLLTALKSEPTELEIPPRGHRALVGKTARREATI